jgi:hypothetical protein
VSVVDGDGNCVTMTHSLGMPSGVITQGLGFMYNGCMGVFDPRPGRAGSLAPGKARFSSICPSIFFKNESPCLVIGAPGATQIAMGVFFNSLIRTIFTAVLYWLVMLAFGVLESPRAWLAIFTAVMAGAAFGAFMQALAGFLENENVFFTIVERFIIMPLFLFSGTFYPLTNMPIFLQWIGWISPLWHATELGRWLTYGSEISTPMLLLHFIFLNSILIFGLIASRRIFTKRLGK